MARGQARGQVRTGAAASARIWGVMAASGTGKGVWLKEQLRQLRPTRLVVWDFSDEYGEFGKQVQTVAGLRTAMVNAGAAGDLCVRYVPKHTAEKGLRAEFEAVCELVFAWENCMFIAEELSLVTTPGWAPVAWRKMSTNGRKAGVHLVGVAQMPALIDKTFLGNCTLIHVGPLHEAAHRDVVERALDIERGSLAGLVKFQWVEKDRDTGQVTSGVAVPKGVPAPPMPPVPVRRGGAGATVAAPTASGGRRRASGGL